MTRRVLSYKRKLDGSTKRRPWEGDVVGTAGDRFTIIYFRSPGYRAGDPETDVEHAFTYAGRDLPLHIFVSFDAAGRLLEYQCDASYPSVFDGDQHSYVDLDLDLIIRPGGVAFERDFDDFALRRVSMNYPPEAVRMAYEGLALAHRLVEAGECPFDGSPAVLLDRLLAAGCGA